jgi:hypothetical protein
MIVLENMKREAEKEALADCTFKPTVGVDIDIDGDSGVWGGEDLGPEGGGGGAGGGRRESRIEKLAEPKVVVDTRFNLERQKSVVVQARVGVNNKEKAQIGEVPVVTVKSEKEKAVMGGIVGDIVKEIGGGDPSIPGSVGGKGKGKGNADKVAERVREKVAAAKAAEEKKVEAAGKKAEAEAEAEKAAREREAAAKERREAAEAEAAAAARAKQEQGKKPPRQAAPSAGSVDMDDLFGLGPATSPPSPVKVAEDQRSLVSEATFHSARHSSGGAPLADPSATAGAAAHPGHHHHRTADQESETTYNSFPPSPALAGLEGAAAPAADLDLASDGTPEEERGRPKDEQIDEFLSWQAEMERKLGGN